LTLAGLCWGVGFPLGKIALEETDAPHMVLLRFAVAAAVALPSAVGRPERRALFGSPMVLLAGALYGIAFVVQFEGLARTSVTLAALLVGSMPAMIALSAHLYGERITIAGWMGVAAVTLGAGLIASRPGSQGSPLGVALTLASLVISILWLAALRKTPRSPTPLALPAVTVVVAAATVFPIALVMHGPPKLALSAPAWLGIIGQGVFSTFIATAAWQFGAQRVKSATAGVFINIEPLLAGAIGVWLFGDRLTPALAVGGAMIVLGSLIVILGERDGSAPIDGGSPNYGLSGLGRRVRRPYLRP
jgi:drug/metabolite transporter (DMT)-like permease